MRRTIITAAAVAGVGILGVGGVAVATTLGQGADGDRTTAAEAGSGADDEAGTDGPGSSSDDTTEDDADGDATDEQPSTPGHPAWPDALTDLGSDDLQGAADALAPLVDAATEALTLLDLTPQELVGELHSGATLGELATEQGVDPEELVELGIAPLEQQLDTAVAEGALTTDEADAAVAEPARSAAVVGGAAGSSSADASSASGPAALGLPGLPGGGGTDGSADPSGVVG